VYRGANSETAGFTKLLAEHVNEYLRPHVPILPDHVRVSNCASAMHDVLAWALANPQDAFLVSRPSYGRLELDFFNKAGVTVEYADTSPENCFDEDVVDKFEAAMKDSASRGVKIKALFIINPHNPLGSFMTLVFDRLDRNADGSHRQVLSKADSGEHPRLLRKTPDSPHQR
jgi:1-aminocyclopropane-1-carboxylate synthase